VVGAEVSLTKKQVLLNELEVQQVMLFPRKKYQFLYGINFLSFDRGT